MDERSPSPQASSSLSLPTGVGRPSRKPAGEGRHNPSGTSAGHLLEYAERRSGSAAGESALSLQKDALVRRAASHPNAKPRSIKSFRATDCTGQTTARTGLPAEVEHDGAARKRYSVARPERKDLTLYVLRDFVSWKLTSNTRGVCYLTCVRRS